MHSGCPAEKKVNCILVIFHLFQLKGGKILTNFPIGLKKCHWDCLFWFPIPSENKVAWIRLKVSDSTSTHISKSKTCFKNLLIRSFRCLLDKIQKMSEFLMQAKTFLRCQKIFWHQTNTLSFQNYEGKANSLYKEPSFNERLVVWRLRKVFVCITKSLISLDFAQCQGAIWKILYNKIFKTGLTFKNIWF